MPERRKEGGEARGADRSWAADVGSTLYARPMPGGGYVRVELLASERRRGRVVIEPRAGSPRRDDAPPLVVVELAGDDEQAVVAELFRIARDNAAIARRVLRRRVQLRGGD